jgi:hypothetical protein
MSAARALARAEAAGLRLRLRPDGGLRVEADRPPPPEVLDELREWRDQVAALLAERDGPSEPDASELGVVGDDSERQALAAYYGGELSAPSYRPSHDDPYTAGLLVSALMRPSSWADPTPPTRGSWCAYCGNPQSGGRWWRPRHPRTDGTGLAPGWRCMTCHPPPDPTEVVEVLT